MNTTIFFPPERPTPAKRLAMFISLALPGAGLAAEGGAGLGATLASADSGLSVARLLLVALFLAGSSRLLLLGTRTVGRPLFLLVLLPMPILLAVGSQISFGDSRSFLPFCLLGVVMPVVMYPLVRSHYRRRANAMPAPPAPSLSKLNCAGRHKFHPSAWPKVLPVLLRRRGLGREGLFPWPGRSSGRPMCEPPTTR